MSLALDSSVAAVSTAVSRCYVSCNALYSTVAMYRYSVLLLCHNQSCSVPLLCPQQLQCPVAMSNIVAVSRCYISTTAAVTCCYAHYRCNVPLLCRLQLQCPVAKSSTDAISRCSVRYKYHVSLLCLLQMPCFVASLP